MRGGALLAEGAWQLPGPAEEYAKPHPASVWLVGTYDGVSVGVAAARRVDVAGRPIAFVEVLYVEPGARGVGVGEALMDELASWARSLGCEGLDVAALPGARAAKSFLEGAGFKARLLVMHRPISTAGDRGA